MHTLYLYITNLVMKDLWNYSSQDYVSGCAIFDSNLQQTETKLCMVSLNITSRAATVSLNPAVVHQLPTKCPLFSQAQKFVFQKI